MTSIERAILAVVPFLAVGLVAAPLLLIVPTSDEPLLASTIHLAALVALGVAAALAVAPFADTTWFDSTRLGPVTRGLASAAGAVALVTGVVALVTLASSATLRFAPSLQFLQLLSSMDIAWAAGAIVIGGYRWRGPVVAAFAGTVTGVVCVWAIWRYLDVVGFTAEGGWALDGGQLWRLVIPVDMVAAAVAVAVLVFGTWRRYRSQ